jgi:hypothetical protein
MRIAAFLLLACSLASAQNRALTAKEIAEGWIELWDGSTLFGWNPEGGAKWRISEGSIVADAGESGWLRTSAAFADFVFECEYRTGVNGNSGVFLRSAKAGEPHITGYELQIWNERPTYWTGSLVNHIQARRIAPVANQWHRYRVRAEGDRFVIHIDGKKVAEGRDKKSAAGYIGLQYNKDNKVEFRNIRLQPLGAKPLFNGKDLTGWRETQPPKPSKEPAVWKAEKGTIHVVHGGGQLETAGLYADYILQLDVRANATDPKRHPNSGVFNRGEPNSYWTGYEVQIRNEYKADDRTQPVDWGTGAVYGRAATRKVVSNDNEYFTMTIVARGGRFTVWVNGYPTTDWEDTRPPAPTRREGTKLAPGTISLQAHDPTTDLNFRNIRLAPLPK